MTGHLPPLGHQEGEGLPYSLGRALLTSIVEMGVYHISCHHNQPPATHQPPTNHHPPQPTTHQPPPTTKIASCKEFLWVEKKVPERMFSRFPRCSQIARTSTSRERYLWMFWQRGPTTNLLWFFFVAKKFLRGWFHFSSDPSSQNKHQWILITWVEIGILYCS